MNTSNDDATQSVKHSGARKFIPMNILSDMLGQNITALVQVLLPAGRIDGREWRCGSLAGDEGRSLGVRLVPPNPGIWGDLATGESGDALDLVAQCRFRGDRRAAAAWSTRWLGLGDVPVPAESRVAAPLPVARDQAAERRAALGMFLAGQERILDTPAGDYLCGRLPGLAELGRQPRSLRFAPAQFNRESGRPWPALLAAICDAAGDHIATHTTWLAPAAGGWTKAPLRQPRRTWPAMAGGSIRLWRGASGKPLASAPEGDCVAISEGIETGLSVAIACPELRVLAAVAVANMARLDLPATIKTVILAADNDGDNASTANAIERAVDRFESEGRRVRVAQPDQPGADWNDVLVGVA